MPEDTAALRVTPDFYIGQGEGAITQISPVNLHVRNLFAATLDSLAEAYAQSLARLRAHNPGINRLIICGGKLSKAEPLRQRIARATGLATSFSPNEDEALYGLMKLARRVEK